jgi:hypothetical protein
MTEENASKVFTFLELASETILLATEFPLTTNLKNL